MIERALAKQTERYLSKLEKQERKLKSKLLKKDSALAIELFPGSLMKKYQQLQALSTGTHGYTSYIAGLDSLSTALKFLSVHQITSNGQLPDALQQIAALQGKLDASAQIQEFIQNRQQLLRNQFQRLGLVKELKSFQKQVYYYKAHIHEYKELFDSPEKWQERILAAVRQMPQFKDFFARHSAFASFFPPATPVDPNQVVSGLQTRSQVMQFVSSNFGGNQTSSSTLLRNITTAQSQATPPLDFSKLKSGSFGDDEFNSSPDFKPNSQKTKSFLKRWELGTNLQSQRGNMFYPVTTDLALSAGYKLNDQSILGIGLSYKVGLGKGFRDFKITHEGIGVRSFADVKLKGNLFISGGFEYNYQKVFANIRQAYNLDDWQKSGLIGLTKTVSIQSKFLKKTRMQLLWDFLSAQQTPRGKAIKFRVGYNF